MKTKTSLLAICLLAAAGAVGKPERVHEAPVINSVPSQVEQAADAQTVDIRDEASDAASWRYLPATTYVAPKVPI